LQHSSELLCMFTTGRGLQSADGSLSTHRSMHWHTSFFSLWTAISRFSDGCCWLVLHGMKQADGTTVQSCIIIGKEKSTWLFAFSPRRSRRLCLAKSAPSAAARDASLSTFARRTAEPALEVALVSRFEALTPWDKNARGELPETQKMRPIILILPRQPASLASCPSSTSSETASMPLSVVAVSEHLKKVRHNHLHPQSVPPAAIQHSDLPS